MSGEEEEAALHPLGFLLAAWQEERPEGDEAHGTWHRCYDSREVGAAGPTGPRPHPLAPIFK